jgi:hypothetical protein
MNQYNENTYSNDNSYIQTDLDEYMTNVFNYLNDMSLEEIWEMFLESEERQEVMAMAEVLVERQFEQLLAERRRLYALGLYELEDGEILE